MVKARTKSEKEIKNKKPNNFYTRFLSEYASLAKYEDIPKKVIESAKDCILDSVGCSIGGSTLKPGKIVIDLFEGMNGIGEATVYSSGKKIPLLHAVYINSYLANLLDFDDTYANFAHPAATVVPPGLNMAEKIGADGRRLLTAVVVGFEISLRIGASIIASPERYKQVFGFSTWQIIGAAACTANLLNFDTEQVSNAFGLAGMNAPVPYGRKFGMEKGDGDIVWCKNNYGWASMGGILGSLLTEKGFVGNRNILDGDKGFWVMAGSDRCDFDKMIEGLGKDFLIIKNSFKPYSSCRWGHSSIDACLKIMKEHKIDHNSISSIKVRSNYEITCTSKELKEPRSIVDAQFNLPYLLALCVSGHPPSEGLSESHLTDPHVLSLLKKVRLELDQEADKLYFDKGIMASTIIIETKSGERFEKSVLIPKGSPENPMSREELEKKFLILSSPVVGNNKALRIVEKIRELEKLRDVSILFAE